MLEDKAKELGRLIGQSAEYKAVKRANESLNQDKDAVDLLRQMEQIRIDAQRMMERGEQPTEEMETKLDELLGKVRAIDMDEVRRELDKAQAAEPNPAVEPKPEKAAGQ